MAHSQFLLSWEQHKKNMCQGLSSLQQNGEFVDMTLAADGHHVKVHQMILALASPYIKELISTAQCPHPVIFLNKISYKTLCAILEYIYTGEVVVPIENLYELIEAGKELHINGLEDMKLHKSLHKNQTSDNNQVESLEMLNEQEMEYLEDHDAEVMDTPDYKLVQGKSNIVSNTRIMDEVYQDVIEDDRDIEDDNIDHDTTTKSDKNMTVMQYTVSNQGSLQMILNRFIYYLKHTNRNQSKQWRCVDYVTNVKCPAYVVTKGDAVIQRILAHTHPFHDKRILKKVRSGAVFSAMQEAEIKGHDITIKRNRHVTSSDKETIDNQDNL